MCPLANIRTISFGELFIPTYTQNSQEVARTFTAARECAIPLDVNQQAPLQPSPANSLQRQLLSHETTERRPGRCILGGQQPFLAVELHGEALGESLQHKNSTISCHAAQTLASSALEVEEPGIVQLGGRLMVLDRTLNDACLHSDSRCGY